EDQLRLEIRDTADNVWQQEISDSEGRGRITLDLSALHSAPGAGPISLRAGEIYRLHIGSKRIPTIYTVSFDFVSSPDQTEGNDTAPTAYELEDLPHTARITGLALQSTTDEDWFKLTLAPEDSSKPDQRTTADRIQVLPLGPGSFMVQLYSSDGTAVRQTAGPDGVIILGATDSTSGNPYSLVGDYL